MRKKTYKIRIIALNIMLLGLFTSQLYSAQPVVSNVTAAQRADSKLVDISYDLADADGDAVTISVRISEDGGQSYDVPAKSFTGDVGPKLAVGEGKQIVWDAGADWDGEFSDTMKVKIIAQDKDDWKGFKGLEFGDEVKPGGFYLGNEATNNGKRVVINHSYWASKYEITVGQFCKFLDMALAEGWITSGNEINATENNPWGLGIGGYQRLAQTNSNLSDGTGFHFDKSRGTYQPNQSADFPVRVEWQGAYVFALSYGYDLPTEAEWAKAAKGPDKNLLPYVVPSRTNTRATWDRWGHYTEYGPVNVKIFYPGTTGEMPFGYSLHRTNDNVKEWTKTIYNDLRSYPSRENLDDDMHRAVDKDGDFAVTLRGATINKDLREPLNLTGTTIFNYTESEWSNYWRTKFYRREEHWERWYNQNGFRVVRRELP